MMAEMCEMQPKRTRVQLEDALARLYRECVYPLLALSILCQYVDDHVPTEIQFGDDMVSVVGCVGNLLSLIVDRAETIWNELGETE